MCFFFLKCAILVIKSHRIQYNRHQVPCKLVHRRAEPQQIWGEPVKVVGVCEACATDGAVGEAVLRVDEKMPSKRARRTQGSPTHWAHVALGVAHHACMLGKTAEKDKHINLP